MIAQRDRDYETLVGLFSTSQHLRYIGTGFDENWAGDFIRQAYPEHNAEIPVFIKNELQIEAFESGSAGWANWLGTLSFEGFDEPQHLRVSWIFTMEGGSWKVASMHLSTPRLNFEVAGHEHSALRDLVQAAKDDPRLVGQEGTTTIMFTDVVDSTSINETVGDRVWANTIKRHLQSVQSLVEDEDGVIVKSLGDGSMSSFTSVRQSMRAAITIQQAVASIDEQPKLEIRIGIHAGDVIKTTDDFIGSVVNKAARLADAATTGQILVSKTAAELVNEDEFTFGETITLNIKGITGASSITPLLWA